MAEIIIREGDVGTYWRFRVVVAGNCLGSERAPGLPPSSPLCRQMMAQGLSAARTTLTAIRTESPRSWRVLTRNARSAIAVRVALNAMDAYLRSEGF